MWTRCGNNGESKVERRKAKRNADNEEETTLSKLMRKSSLKEKIVRKKRTTKARNKIPSLLPEKFKGKKTEKAGVVVEEEHLLSFIDVCDDNVILDTGASMMYMQVDIQ